MVPELFVCAVVAYSCAFALFEVVSMANRRVQLGYVGRGAGLAVSGLTADGAIGSDQREILREICLYEDFATPF